MKSTRYFLLAIFLGASLLAGCDGCGPEVVVRQSSGMIAINPTDGVLILAIFRSGLT